MWLRISSDFTFEISVPTPFLLMLRPRSAADQWIASEQYKITPSVPVSEFTDLYGNLVQRLIAPAGIFKIHTTADVMISDHCEHASGIGFVEIQNLPDTTLTYLLPSRYCESDHFNQMATEITSGQALGYDQVVAITSWIRETIRFEPENSHELVSATEVNARRSGVCRDLSHLAIAMCRSLSIPARMVVGYLHELEPSDLHAWFEVYLENRWYSFDATQEQMKGGYVAIGYGRDAADVAVYNQFGPALFPASKIILVEKIEDETLEENI